MNTEYTMQTPDSDAKEHRQLGDFEQKLLKHPLPVFGRAMQTLRRQIPWSHRPRVRVRFSADLEANAQVARRICYRLLGYQVQVNAGLYHLFNDTAELLISRSAIISKTTGETVDGPYLTTEQFLTILKESVSQYVRGENKWLASDQLASNHSQRLLRELRLRSEHRRSFIHFGWLVMMATYMMAHELGHIMMGHLNHKPGSDEESQREELQADAFAADSYLRSIIYVMPYLYQKQKVFTDPFGALVGLTSNSLAIQNIFQLQVRRPTLLPEHAVETHLAECLNAIAGLFMILELAERAAKELNIPRRESHPRATWRYQFFRDFSVNGFGLPSTHFDSFRSGTSPPDQIFEGFLKMAQAISWKDSAAAPPSERLREENGATIPVALPELKRKVGDT